MKLYIRTYGCQMNERDSENIAVDFLERGWTLTENPQEADVAIVNTCSVREQAERKASGLIGRILYDRVERKATLPVVGVTGCMAQNKGGELVKEFPELDFVAGPRKTHLVPQFALSILEKRKRGELLPELPEGMRRRTFKYSDALVDVSDDTEGHLHINRHMGAPACAFVSIMQGCQMNCSYCIVPKVRGIQRSRPIEDVVKEVKYLAERGTKEVMLLGQVANAYGRDFASSGGVPNFVRLLQEINDISGIERIRYTSPHPAYFNDDLINAYGSLEKLCEYVHLPLQSGSDEILKKMNRPYRVKKFLEIVERLRSRAKGMSISTDIIVGYPSETDNDFQQTRQAFADAAFDMAFIFKYSPREGTKSALLPDDISEEIKDTRNKILLDDLAKTSLDFNNAMVGSVEQVLVESHARRGDGLLMGRTRNHRKAIFAGEDSLIGRLVNVEIKSATTTALDSVLV